MMEILAKINWVDILAVIILLRTSYVALQDGLSHEIFPLLASIFTISLALHYYNKIALYICQNGLNIPIELLELLAFVALILVLGFVFKFMKVILDKIIKVTWHPVIERFGGLVVGALRGCVTVSIILIILAMIPLSYLSWSIRDRSLSGMYFLRIGPDIYERLVRFLPTIKVEGAPVNKEGFVKRLASDKAIAPEAKKDTAQAR